jgi:predicted regulator of Ras-like GTPase activity (Roadblock/LC7/MglB family)
MTIDSGIMSPPDFAWLVNGFVEKVHGATHALILSSDGFPLTASESVNSDDAEQLAAIASGLLGLAATARRCSTRAAASRSSSG